jgi:hypothetical protein
MQALSVYGVADSLGGCPLPLQEANQGTFRRRWRVGEEQALFTAGDKEFEVGVWAWFHASLPP